jgi:hypothetical protein
MGLMDMNDNKERVTTVISQRLPNFIAPHLAPSRGDQDTLKV